MINRVFPLGDVLSVTTGMLVGSSGLGGVHDVLGHLHNKNFYTHELSANYAKAEPFLRELLPKHYDEEMEDELDALTLLITGVFDDEAGCSRVCDEWVARQAERLGETITLPQL